MSGAHKMTTWHATKYKGVRYREQPKKKHGIRPDKYFSIRYQFEGKRKEEGVGWQSEGWTAEKAALKLAELKQAAKTGEGARHLSEKREARKKSEREAIAIKKERERRATTYEQYFIEHYLPEIEHDKSGVAVRDEKSIHKNSILPNIGSLSVLHIGELDLKRIIRAMSKAGRAPRTIQLALAHVRMVINHAIRSGYHAGPNPVSTMPRNSKPKVENRRLRFFTPNEAGELLERLLSRSKDVHDMTLLSLYCGLRAGEIFKLTWRHVDFTNRQVTLIETKSGRDRTVPIPEKVYEMFRSRTEGPGNALAFPDSKGNRRVRITKTFEKAVDDMGLNNGITDRKDKLVFHSCRHTCASWLVQAGVPLLTVKEILGHSTIALTERYSHIAPDGTRAALQVMEKAIQESRTKGNVQQLVNYG
jgi:integrase